MKNKATIRKLTLFLAIFLLYILLAGPQMVNAFMEVQPDSSEEPIISKITIEGTQNVDESEIRNELTLEAGDRLEETQLQEDLQRIFDLGYFQSLYPETNRYGEGIELILVLSENPELKGIDFIGDLVYEKEEFINLLEMESGQIIDVIQLGKGLSNIENRLAEAGYFPPHQYAEEYSFIDYDHIEISPEGQLLIPLNVARLDQILIEGNEKTKDFVIKNEIDLKQGEPLKINKIQDVVYKLHRLDFFEEVIPEPIIYESEDNKVDLLFNIKEHDTTGNFHFGGSWSSVEGGIGHIDYQERNLFGYGKGAGFRWEFGGAHHFSLHYDDPNIMNSDFSLALTLFDREKRFGNIDERGGYLTLGHPLTDDWRGRVRYGLVDEWQYDDTDELIDSGRMGSLTLGARQDTRNHYFHPSEGKYLDISLEVANELLGSDDYFSKVNFDGRKFLPGLAEDQVWAFRTRLGTSDGELTPGNKFLLGGSETLRGYEFGEFSGEHLFLGNLEYRFLLEEQITGVLFGDLGRTWDRGEELRPEGLNFGLGLGVRIDTPLGQVRLDYGWNDQGEGRPYFSVGHTF